MAQKTEKENKVKLLTDAATRGVDLGFTTEDLDKISYEDVINRYVQEVSPIIKLTKEETQENKELTNLWKTLTIASLSQTLALGKELEDLLNEAQDEIEIAESVTGLAAIRTPRVNEIKTDYDARAGIIKAVMAARNDQISVATNLIDRTINSIKNDKNTQLDYYQNVLNFYDKLRTEEGTKLITLTKDEQTYVNAKIKLLEDDLSGAQKTADYIKQLMINPETAEAMEKSGVTLNDSIETISAKVGTYMAQKTEKENKVKLLTDAATRGIDLGFTTEDLDKISYEDVINKYVQKVPEFLQKIDTGELEPAQWPSSYREWYMAGGQKGTGLSYNQYLEKRRTSAIGSWERQVQGYATKGMTNMDLFKKELGITTDEMGNWEIGPDTLTKIRLLKTPTSKEIKTAVSYFDAAILYLIYANTGRGAYPGEIEATKKTYGIDWLDVAAFPEAGLNKLMNIERMLKMTLENPSSSPYIQQMGQISDVVKDVLNQEGY